MIFDETRDNLTDTENQSIEADAHADTRERRETWRERKLRQAEAMFGKVGSSRMSQAMENRVADSWWATLHAKAADTRDHETTWTECQCEACNSAEQNDGANGYENHVGDGPSGFDYYHDTKWCC